VAVACLAGATPAFAQPSIGGDFAATVTIDAGVLTAIQVLNEDPSSGTVMATIPVSPKRL
jgi:hypothetical protein